MWGVSDENIAMMSVLVVSVISYLPILHLARDKGIKLLALNVESEAIAKVTHSHRKRPFMGTGGGPFF